MAGKNSGDIRCSFCNKTQDQVKKLIAGPGGVYICDECVELCNEILDALRIYSDEWKWCIDELEMFVPKCVRHLYCSEKYTCGRRPTYSKVAQYIERGKLEEDKVANEAQFDQGD